jgi:hypothetical protein
MASCVGCKKRTTSFCYVHRTSVCDDCTALKGAGLPAPAAVVCQPHDVVSEKRCAAHNSDAVVLN